MIHTYNTWIDKSVSFVMFLPVDWDIQDLSVPSAEANPTQATTKDIDVSHRQWSDQGDAPNKNFDRNDWIPIDAVSRTWRTTRNNLEGMFIPSSYHFLHLDPITILLYYDDAFDSCAFLHALPCTYVHQQQKHCTLIAVCFSCDTPRACFINPRH